jgi:hypothetical protein
MKTWIRVSLILIGLGLQGIGLTTANAQNLDLIGAYRSIQNSLEVARVTLGKDPAGALARVEGAANVFRKVSGSLAPALSGGGNAALKNAGTAVSRGSSTDFAAQAGQVRAILERGLLEKYLTLFGTPAQASRYASVLGKSFKLSAATQKDLNLSTKSGNVSRARGIIELQLANTISNALGAARDNAANRSSAFGSASRAANTFLIVQDSPRVGELSVGSFTGAITTLTSGDTAGFQQAAGGLIAQVRSFAARARGLISSSPQSGATRPAVRPTPPATQPNPPAARPTPPAAAPPATVPNVNALKNSLVKAGIAAPQAENLARDLSKQGFSSLSGVLDGISVQLSSALSDIQDANVPDGRAEISNAKNIFDSSLRAVVEAADPALATRVSRVFEATEAASGVRPVDVTVLLGEIDTIRKWSEGKPASGLQALVATVQPWWMGWLRGGLFLVAALLFTYPIYLLNLAFGGRNPYWRYIGIAMVLLFIPPLLEGLAWLGSFIAQGTGLRFFDGIASFSVLQNPLAQIGWVIILFATVFFATAGFRGIATQFGLIRGRNQGTGAPTSMGTVGFGNANPTPMDRPAMNTQQVPTTERTIVEWDEEF